MPYSSDFFDFPVYDLDQAPKQNDVGVPSTITILLSSPVSKDQRDLLDKILKAVRLTEDQYHVLELSSEDSYTLRYDTNERYLCFGIQPEQLHLSIERIAYSPIQIRNTEIVFSHNLAILSEHVQAKKLLWQCLQEMFLTE